MSEYGSKAKTSSEITLSSFQDDKCLVAQEWFASTWFPSKKPDI